MIEQLEAEIAARMGVAEVHLQRLVFDATGYGMARAEQSLFEQTREAFLLAPLIKSA